MESIEELRRLVQEPVEHRNDLTGKLYGSRLSIFITRFFLKHGWHANVASFLMLFNGLAGATLLVFPGGWQVAGFFLLVTYYLFDCVDGELARYHGISSLRAAYYDYVAHVAVKSAMFLGLGIGLARDPAVGASWPLLVACAPLLAVLFTKIVDDVHYVIFGSKFLVHRDHEAVENFLRTRRRGAAAAAAVPRRRGLGVLRELVLNFDVYLILFMTAAVVDVLVEPPAAWPAWLGAKMALLLFYAVALPLNFLDRFLADLLGERLLDRLERLRRRVEDGREDEDSPR